MMARWAVLATVWLLTDVVDTSTQLPRCVNEQPGLHWVMRLAPLVTDAGQSEREQNDS